MNNDLSLSTVQTLTTLYQKAIEYYSAFDDLLYNDFLNRMQSLLQREDIQMVLNSVEEGNNILGLIVSRSEAYLKLAPAKPRSATTLVSAKERH